jgi:DNA modification methylase
MKPKALADGIAVWCSHDEIGPLEKAIENPRNPNKHPEAQIKLLANIIKVQGWRNPITISKLSGFITKGAGRRKAAELLGVSQVPLDYQDYENEAAEYADLIADNRIAELAEPDLDLVKDILESIEGLDAELTGYNLDDLGMAEEPPEDPGAQLDKAEELQHEWKTECGQVWEIPSKASPGKTHRLMCGDSTNQEEVKTLLDGKVPFIMVTDPPYGVNYDPEWRVEAGANERTHGSKLKNDDRFDWTETYKLFPGTVSYVWHSSTHSIDVGINLRDADFQIRAAIIWNKDLAVFGRGHYHWKHEPCWYAVRKGRSSKWCGDRTEKTVWDIPTIHSFKNGKNEEEWGLVGHGTQKPLECMARPIRNHGGKDDDVYDPFLGSGTTMIAAERSGRVCFGMEIDPKYCAVILQRCLDMGLEPVLAK